MTTILNILLKRSCELAGLAVAARHACFRPKLVLQLGRHDGHYLRADQ